MCVWGWRGWLPPQSQQKHTHTRTHTLDSMLKLILLHCLETCLLLCAVTLISSRQSYPGYKISVFCRLLSLFVPLFYLQMACGSHHWIFLSMAVQSPTLLASPGPREQVHWMTARTHSYSLKHTVTKLSFRGFICM